MNTQQVSLSKFLSLVLRHKPSAIGIKLTEDGWADVNELIKGFNKKGKCLDLELLEYIVINDDKQRYKFNEDKTKVRANQGHSINVSMDFDKCVPPKILYHGSVKRFVGSIEEKGLLKMSRNYVHLSADTETAKKVAARRGNCALFEVDASSMISDGYLFYRSENGVFLTKHVPAKYLKLIS